MTTRAMREACAEHEQRLEALLAQVRGEAPCATRPAPTHLNVRIDGHVRALPLDCVREVLPPARVVRLRGAPAGIRGLVQARGRAVAVHATLRRMPLAPVLVLVEHAGDCHALEVDAVLDLGDAADTPVLDVASLIARM